MSIFRKNTPPPSPARDRPISSRPPSIGDAAISIIGQGMVVIGDLTTDGIIRIEGEVQGTIRAAKSVIIGKEGVVKGDLVTAEAIIGGRVQGTITADHRLELQSTSFVDGEVRSRAECMKLEEGARFSGRVQILGEEGQISTISKEIPLLSAQTVESA